MSRWVLEEAKYTSSFARIAGLIAGVIRVLLVIPELISKLGAGIFGLFAAVLALVGYVADWFISNILQTELLDGGFGRGIIQNGGSSGGALGYLVDVLW